MNPPAFMNVQDCDSSAWTVWSRPVCEQTLNAGKIDVNYRDLPVYGRIASVSRTIPLDFCQYTTDTSGNTLAAPLFRQVKCLRNDVHQGRVFLKHKARLEPDRITAAPPLVPSRHNAVLGRLLSFGDLPFQAGGHR